MDRDGDANGDAGRDPGQLVAAARSLARTSRVLERALGDLSLAHYRVLTAVADGDERASRVARRLALGKPTVSASVEALCRRGLLDRAGVAADQRCTTLLLTTAGRARLAEADRAVADALAGVVERTGDPAGTTTTLAGLGPALDQRMSERWPMR